LYKLTALSILDPIAGSDGRSPFLAYSVDVRVTQPVFPLTILSISTISKADDCTEGVKHSYPYGNRPSKKRVLALFSNSPPTNPTYSALFPTKSFPVLPPSFVVGHPPKSLSKNTASKLTESATQLTQQIFLSLHLEQSIQ
jgi:hypothetical protein